MLYVPLFNFLRLPSPHHVLPIKLVVWKSWLDVVRRPSPYSSSITPFFNSFPASNSFSSGIRFPNSFGSITLWQETVFPGTEKSALCKKRQRLQHSRSLKAVLLGNILLLNLSIYQSPLPVTTNLVFSLQLLPA